MSSFRNKIKTWRGAKEEIDGWKDQGFKLVFTNGCFDIIHLGHVDYLERARSLGDRLIVGLNSDESVRRLKGAERPVVTLAGRSGVLAAMASVDMVVAFDEDTPKNLISIICPDVLVKGGDYDVDNIVGADIVIENGGVVRTLDFVEGHSTSKIVEKLRST